MTLQLEKQQCNECKKEIMVNNTQPIETYEEFKQTTGIYLTYMDEDYQERNIGFLCDICATKLCADGIISLGCSGYDVDGLATSKYFTTKYRKRNA